MSQDPTSDYYIGIVTELRMLPFETEWAEFKHNNADPQDIGEYLSAISNSAALCGKTHGYVVWAWTIGRTKS